MISTIRDELWVTLKIIQDQSKQFEDFFVDNYVP